MKFKSLRPHQGDKWYNAGDERNADEREVAHLVASGTLEKIADPVENETELTVASKAEPPVDDKAELPVDDKAELPVENDTELTVARKASK